MVVLRPKHSQQPEATRHHASVEQVLVELLIEASNLALMDTGEAKSVVKAVMSGGRVQLSDFQMYAGFRRVALDDFQFS